MGLFGVYFPLRRKTTPDKYSLYLLFKDSKNSARALDKLLTNNASSG